MAKAPATAASANDRGIAVMRAVLNRFKPEKISATDWRAIAAEAGIIDGDVARNAKYAFEQFIGKSGGLGGTGAKKRGKSETKDEEEDEGEEAAVPKKKTKTVAKARGKGKGKAKVDDDEVVKDEAGDEDEEVANDASGGGTDDAITQE